MRESRKHWRKKHPNIHRRYGEKRDRDEREDQLEQEQEVEE